MPVPERAAKLWVRRTHPCAEGTVRLFCFPHAGGSATYYYPFAKALAPDVDVRAIQYPGRQDRRHEPCIDNIARLADSICDAICDTAEPPFAFFGHSMGAIVAFEVAQRLAAAARSGPCWFFASGRRAPSRKRPAKVYRDPDVLAELRRLGGTDPLFLEDADMLAAIIPVARNDYNAIEGYNWQPGPLLSCPVTALIGDTDPQCTINEASAWADHFSGPFEIRTYRGGHFYLDYYWTKAAETVTASLASAARQLDSGSTA
jgi:surfactin synthase thioesterase subunit